MKYIAHHLDHTHIWAIEYGESASPTGYEFYWSGTAWETFDRQHWALDKLWMDPSYEEITLPDGVPPVNLVLA